MPLAKTIPVLRKELHELLVEDLPAALTALKELLPETCNKHGQIVALQSGLYQLNKDKIRGVIDATEYRKGLAQLSADCYDLIQGLEEVDFLPAVALVKDSKASKSGSVLYRIPQKMPLRKPSICTIRVAIDEDAILEDIVIDDNVRLRQRVEVSDRMSAELLDTEGNVFDIAGFNAVQQKVRDTGYTQWLFRVTPKVEGEHQLLVKVSLLEFDANTNEYVPRDVSIMETVTIVTETLPAVVLTKEGAPSDAEPPLKSSGHQFSIGPKTSKLPKSNATKSKSRSLYAIAIFLGFLILAPSATWALTPPLPRDLFLATLQANLIGSTAGLDGFIQEYQKDPVARPYLEKAYFRKADKTDALADFRAYQREFPDGDHKTVIVDKIRILEVKAVASIQQNPELAKIQQFVADFPDAEHLPEVKKAAEARPEIRTAVLPILENAYVVTMQVQPSEKKARDYINDFPQQERLNEVTNAAATQPEIFKRVQPELEDAYLNKMRIGITEDQSTQFLQRFPEPVRRVEFEKILTQNPTLKKAAVEKMENAEADRKVQEAETARLDELQRRAAAANDEQERQRLAKEAAQEAARLRTRDSLAEAERQRALAEQQRLEAEARRDTDGDGIPDKDDRCPNEKGTSADAGCPPKPIETPAPNNDRNQRSGLDMVRVQGGSFTMGSNDYDNEKPPHSVTVPTFSIGKYEVTQADWRSVMGSDPPELYNTGCDECPVESVSWDDIQGFIKALNKKSGKKYRLPTEAEWEYAARGGNKSMGYQYAGGNELGKVAWYDDNYKTGETLGMKKTTHRVGDKAANELGLFDMSGNVYEWCEDIWHDDYTAAPKDGSAWTSGSSASRVLRGGAWSSYSSGCSVSWRFSSDPRSRDDNRGFRLAQD